MEKLWITQHALERSDERLGLNKSAARRMAARAFEFGITRERLTGDLARYIDHEYNKHKVATNIRLYADKVFLFEGVKLITVFSIPRTLLRAYRKIVAREEAA